MISFPNCKINIGLYVTGKRTDGYHNLETIFYPVPVTDALEIVPGTGGETQIHLAGKAIAGDKEKNLVWKAYQLLKQLYPAHIPVLDIHLLKNIPMGAGLGGGSADGAFMLRLLNDTYQMGITETELETYALQLGSDCPFFIQNKPVIATGRGEVMEPVSLDLSAYSLQLICPGIHISTALAFGNITPAPAAISLREMASMPPRQWKNLVQNDFERTVFTAHPALAKIKDDLYAGGALYASMTGTGSCIYGIFPKEKKAIFNGDWEQFYIL